MHPGFCNQGHIHGDFFYSEVPVNYNLHLAIAQVDWVHVPFQNRGRFVPMPGSGTAYTLDR